MPIKGFIGLPSQRQFLSTNCVKSFLRTHNNGKNTAPSTTKIVQDECSAIKRCIWKSKCTMMYVCHSFRA